MSMHKRVAVSQKGETEAVIVGGDVLSHRYLYARSYDAQAHNDTGQDYIAIQGTHDRLAFAVCDGVGQSFFGDVASRVLGEALVDWLWNAPAGDPPVLEQRLGDALRALTSKATPEVNALTLPTGLSPRVRDVLEKKRDSGSESIFVGGLVDLRDRTLLLTWMGDCRLRLFSREAEVNALDTGRFEVRQRWSSRVGPVHGEPNVVKMPIGSVTSVIAYSDGLARLDVCASPPSVSQLTQEVQMAYESSTSDDVSFVEIWLDGSPPWEAAPGSAMAHPDAPVPPAADERLAAPPNDRAAAVASDTRTSLAPPVAPPHVPHVPSGSGSGPARKVARSPATHPRDDRRDNAQSKARRIPLPLIVIGTGALLLLLLAWLLR